MKQITRKSPTRKTLVLGTGRKPYSGATHHDITKHSTHIDIAHNLSLLPWPWHDGAFDFIIAESVLEHLDIDLLEAMNEAWRVLETHGRIHIKLPYWNSEVTWNDPTHRRGYGLGIFDQFDDKTERGTEYNFYTPRRWRILKPAKLNKSKSSLLATLRKIECRK